MAFSREPGFAMNEIKQRKASYHNPSIKPMLSPNYEYVVALDIGSTYSAYAYAHKDDIDIEKHLMNISCNQAWNSGKSNCITIKTPTSVLLHDNGELDSIGYEAEDKYARLVKTKVTTYYFFKKFKMSLYKSVPTSQMTLDDVNGRCMLAETVFAKLILALKKEFFESLIKSGIHLSNEDIRWVVTVPAIWSEAAKRFMRKCANLADIQDNQLIIALEPEAASIYCQYVKSKDIRDPKLTVSSTGTQYMVVDLGGGTVDIAVHETLGDGYLKEIHRATGEDCGGNSINQSLVEEMTRNFGGPFIRQIEQSHPKEYFDIHREFEAAKKNFDPFNEHEMSLRLPYIFLNKICKELTSEKFEQILHLGPHHDRLTVENDWVHISTSLVKERLFEPTAERICKLIRQILSKVNNLRLTKILLVGGLSDSKYIQDAIRKEFPTKKVIVPQDADICVVKGAVMFGHSPHLISHRVSRFSYGVGIAPEFDSSEHDASRKIVIEGVERCSDVFDLLAASGSVLEMNTTIKRTHITLHRYQKAVDLSIFASSRENPKYTDEDECEKIGHFVIQLKNPTEQEREVVVTVVFGNTELKLYAFDKTSGEECDASFDLPLF